MSLSSSGGASASAAPDDGPSGLQDPVVQSELVLASISQVMCIIVLSIQWYRGKSLRNPMMVSRGGAQLFLLVHIFFEVASSVDASLCSPYLRLSDNANTSAIFFARLFFVYRTTACFIGAQQKTIRRVLFGAVVVLYAKTILLINILGVDVVDDISGCDFIFPAALSLYIAFENIAFDLAMLLVTVRALWSLRTKSHNIIITAVIASNTFVLASIAFLVISAFTYGIVEQQHILFEIICLDYIISIWVPDLIIASHRLCGRNTIKKVVHKDPDSEEPTGGNDAAMTVALTSTTHKQSRLYLSPDQFAAPAANPMNQVSHATAEHVLLSANDSNAIAQRLVPQGWVTEQKTSPAEGSGAAAAATKASIAALAVTDA